MFYLLTFTNENDKLKFDFLYDKYKKLLLYKSYDILKDYSLAEDAVSEAYMRIYKNLHKIEDIESKKTISFIVTIVKNVSITLYNKRNKVDLIDFQEYEEEDDFSLEDYVVSKDVTNNILNIVDSLKEDLKAPFLLKYAHNLSHKEISVLLKITENNVTVRIHRAKKKLSKILKKEGNFDG